MVDAVRVADVQAGGIDPPGPADSLGRSDISSANAREWASSAHGLQHGEDDVRCGTMTLLPNWVNAARGQWAWYGQVRPPFAVVPGPGEESVWDYPRPPRLALDQREVVVRWGDLKVARTRRAVRVLETSHPPSYYVPWDDLAKHLLEPAPGTSFCEWKGPASYWTLVDGDRRLDGAAWSYPHPFAGAEALAGCVAFYAGALDCRVDDAPVRPQPGGFYGGWITPELVGPFKSDPGSQHW